MEIKLIKKKQSKNYQVNKIMIKKIIFALLVLILIPTAVLAWNDCPSGEVLCEGKCGQFIDTDNDGICDHSQPAPKDRNKEIAASIKTEQGTAISESNNNKNKKIYHLLPISLFLILMYIISHILSKKKIISIVSHRKTWNMLLLITFLISAIPGILLVIKINFGITIPLPFNILFWHVEAGIAMTVISIFHIIWHWAYFKNVFRIKN